LGYGLYKRGGISPDRWKAHWETKDNKKQAGEKGGEIEGKKIINDKNAEYR
jgi:hypothetical protein